MCMISGPKSVKKLVKDLKKVLLLFVCFRYLLSLGADTEAENDCGEKPADLIDPESKELLELFGVGGD